MKIRKRIRENSIDALGEVIVRIMCVLTSIIVGGLLAGIENPGVLTILYEALVISWVFKFLKNKKLCGITLEGVKEWRKLHFIHNVATVLVILFGIACTWSLQFHEAKMTVAGISIAIAIIVPMLYFFLNDGELSLERMPFYIGGMLLVFVLSSTGIELAMMVGGQQIVKEQVVIQQISPQKESFRVTVKGQQTGEQTYVIPKWKVYDREEGDTLTVTTYKGATGVTWSSIEKE